MTIDIQIPLGPFRQAISTVFGAILAFIIVSMLGAAVPTIAAFWGDSGGDSFVGLLIWLSLAWISQWLASGIMLWGLVFLIIHVLILQHYVYGGGDPLFDLTLLFADQCPRDSAYSEGKSNA